jgi:hypothetical protein
MNSIAGITVEQKAALRKVVDVLRKEAPSVFCGLNVAQYRALKAMYTLDSDSGHPPALNIISFANGVGKSHLMILDMIGWCCGHEYLNGKVFPVEAIAWYNFVKPLRDAGKLSLRLSCEADDMRDSGSVLMLLNEWFPMAKVTARDQNGCYRQIDVPHPTIPGVVNHISVKTFDQAVGKHSGSTCNRVWINEPIRTHLVGETIGRIRSKAGGVPGSIAMFATLVSDADWVYELDDDTLGVCHSRGHLYENCDGGAVTEKMAAEVKRSIGVALRKDEQNGGYITNGMLSKDQIDRMILYWKIVSPHELEVRKSGAPISCGGKIYPHFRRDVHVIDEYKVNPKWPVIMVADPHSARPTFVVWGQITPQDRIIIFDEWPDGRYETLDERRFTVPQECEIWNRVERSHGINENPMIRIGDPNRFREPQVYTGQTLQSMYDKHGFKFDTDVPDDLAVGHAKVNEYLHFDDVRLTLNKDDPTALPRLFVCKKCTNVIRAFEGYAFKKGRKADSSVTESVNHKFKDAMDTIRYAVMHHAMNKYESISDKSETTCSDYLKYCRGRSPSAYNKSLYGVNLNGRRRVA